MKKYNITALGEILIDFTPMDKSKSGMQVFEQNARGAPANVLACATKFGQKTAFIGKVGQDMQGEFLRQTLVQAGIETKGLISDKDFFTTLAFVSLTETGERSFSFARKPGADTQISVSEVDVEILKETKIFHFGSLSLTHNPSHDATIYAIEFAKNNGAIISYDPNYRELLWDSFDSASQKMKSVLKYVDILKISDQETEIITCEKDPYVASKILIDMGIPVVSITLGEDGAMISNKKGTRYIEAIKADKVVDTTGAGDCFWGAMLYKIGQSVKHPSQLDIEELASFTKFANAAASLCVRKRGAMSSIPTLEEIAEIYK